MVLSWSTEKDTEEKNEQITKHFFFICYPFKLRFHFKTSRKKNSRYEIITQFLIYILSSIKMSLLDLFSLKIFCFYLFWISRVDVSFKPFFSYTNFIELDGWTIIWCSLQFTFLIVAFALHKLKFSSRQLGYRNKLPPPPPTTVTIVWFQARKSFANTNQHNEWIWCITCENKLCIDFSSKELNIRIIFPHCWCCRYFCCLASLCLCCFYLFLSLFLRKQMILVINN